MDVDDDTMQQSEDLQDEEIKSLMAGQTQWTNLKQDYAKSVWIVRKKPKAEYVLPYL